METGGGGSDRRVTGEGPRWGENCVKGRRRTLRSYLLSVCVPRFQISFFLNCKDENLNDFC